MCRKDVIWAVKTATAKGATSEQVWSKISAMLMPRQFASTAVEHEGHSSRGLQCLGTVNSDP